MEIPIIGNLLKSAGCGVVAAALLAAFFLSDSFCFLLPPVRIGDFKEIEDFEDSGNYFTLAIPGAQDTGICTYSDTMSGAVYEEMIYYCELEEIGFLIAKPIREGYETPEEMPLSLPGGDMIAKVGPDEDYRGVAGDVDREHGYSQHKPLYENILVESEFYFLRGRVNTILILAGSAAALAFMLAFFWQWQKERGLARQRERASACA